MLYVNISAVFSRIILNFFQTKSCKDNFGILFLDFKNHSKNRQTKDSEKNTILIDLSSTFTYLSEKMLWGLDTVRNPY